MATTTKKRPATKSQKLFVSVNGPAGKAIWALHEFQTKMEANLDKLDWSTLEQMRRNAESIRWSAAGIKRQIEKQIAELDKRLQKWVAENTTPTKRPALKLHA